MNTWFDVDDTPLTKKVGVEKCSIRLRISSTNNYSLRLDLVNYQLVMIRFFSACQEEMRFFLKLGT